MVLDAGESSKELHQSDFLMVRYIEENSIGMRRTALAEKKSNRLSPKKRSRAVSQYAVCVRNDNYVASLELRKLYQIVPDKSLNVHGLIRIIDESGKSYLYPAEYFLPIKLSPATQKAIRLVL